MKTAPIKEPNLCCCRIRQAAIAIVYMQLAWVMISTMTVCVRAGAWLSNEPETDGTVNTIIFVMIGLGLLFVVVFFFFSFAAHFGVKRVRVGWIYPMIIGNILFLLCSIALIVFCVIGLVDEEKYQSKSPDNDLSSMLIVYIAVAGVNVLICIFVLIALAFCMSFLNKMRKFKLKGGITEVKVISGHRISVQSNPPPSPDKKSPAAYGNPTSFQMNDS